jgi:hypothetical protein
MPFRRRHQIAISVICALAGALAMEWWANEIRMALHAATSRRETTWRGLVVRADPGLGVRVDSDRVFVSRTSTPARGGLERDVLWFMAASPVGDSSFQRSLDRCGAEPDRCAREIDTTGTDRLRCLRVKSREHADAPAMIIVRCRAGKLPIEARYAGSAAGYDDFRPMLLRTLGAETAGR